MSKRPAAPEDLQATDIINSNTATPHPGIFHIFSGKAFADVKVNADIKILTLNQNSYQINEDEKDAEIIAFNPNVSDKDFTAKSVELMTASDRLDVGDAEILVAGGRGMKSAEKFKVLDEMAEKPSLTT